MRLAAAACIILVFLVNLKEYSDIGDALANRVGLEYGLSG